MSTDERGVSDETLMAYVDGELDGAEQARVEAAIAASVVIGVLVSMLYLRPDGGSPIATRGGQLVARGDLARALSNQLGGESAGENGVKIPVSFRTKSGELCRAFVLGEQTGTAGLACRSGNDWNVQVLARTEGSGSEGSYRPAGSALPSLVTQAVDERIDGEPLDAQGEANARERGWRVP